MRRSRGFVPDALRAAGAAARPLLACGAELKSTFCVAKGARAWVGHHIGDLKSYEVLQAYEAGIEHFERLFAVVPEVVAHDEHPDYLSTRVRARPRGRRDTSRVQHHHAHLAACLAEHGEPGRRSARSTTARATGATAACGAARSSSATCATSSAPRTCGRCACRAATRAVRQPWRMAVRVAARGRLGRPAAAARDRAPVGAGRRARPHRARVAVDDEHGAAVRRGRGAVRAADEVTYEGQAAIELEAVARPGERGALRHARRSTPRPTILAVAARPARRDRPGRRLRPLPQHGRGCHRRGAAPPRRRSAASAPRSCPAACSRTGGCSTRPPRACAPPATAVLVPERLPPDDGGIAYGQAAVAAATAP